MVGWLLWLVGGWAGELAIWWGLGVVDKYWNGVYLSWCRRRGGRKKGLVMRRELVARGGALWRDHSADVVWGGGSCCECGATVVTESETGEELCKRHYVAFLRSCESRYGSISEVVDFLTGHEYARHRRVLSALVAGYIGGVSA